MLFGRYIALAMTILPSVIQPTHAITISATTNWETCNLQGLITEAGDYYSSTLEPSTTLTCPDAYLSITNAGGSDWIVSSKLENSLSGLQLDLQRVDNGQSGSTPTGGEAYINQITSLKEFFRGQGDVSDIKIRFQITNFDVTDGNDTKNIQLYYDVTTY